MNEYLDEVRSDPERLREFTADLPKGGDLHNHLHGAVSTESLIRYAAEDERCIDVVSLAASPGPCSDGERPAEHAVTDAEFRESVLRAWSMKDFDPNGPDSGHDHFFETFGKFSAAAEGRDGDMLAEVATAAERQNQSYVETMFSRQSEAVAELVERRGFDPNGERDFQRLRQDLRAGGAVDAIVDAARRDTDRDLARHDDLLNCGDQRADPACDVRLRFDYQVSREDDPAMVFAQLLLGFELAERDERFVGINMVQPEDGPIALRDYTLHMRMVGFLREHYPDAHVTLHAGELVPGLVKPEDLTFHIDQAVRIAGAERIGHGVDLHHEHDWRALAARMRDDGILVESPLTSNCQILEVCGPEEHPLPAYLAMGVPVALATDDPGVSRSDLTADYQFAAQDYGFNYSELKASARNALHHAFIDGDSLWRGDRRPHPACSEEPTAPGGPSAECAGFLNSSDKAALQWEHEQQLREFELRYAART